MSGWFFIVFCLFAFELNTTVFYFQGVGTGIGGLFSPSWWLLEHDGQHTAQLLTFPLGTDVRAHPLLDELECPFVLGDLEQLHSATLRR